MKNPLKKLLIPGSHRKDTRTVGLTAKEAFLLWKNACRIGSGVSSTTKYLLFDLIREDERRKFHSKF